MESQTDLSLFAILCAVSTVLGISTFIDKHLKDEYKRSISEFLNGGALRQPFSDFERALINALMKFFLRDGYVKASAVMWYSLVGAGLIAGVDMFTQLFTPRPVSAGSILLTLGANTAHYAFISFGADFFSLFMTKMIFIDEKFGQWPFLARWLADTLISIGMPLVIILGVAWVWYSVFIEPTLDPSPHGFYKAIPEPMFISDLKMGLWVTMLMSSLLSLYQLFLIVFGTALRCAMRGVSVGYRSSGRFLRVENSPLSFITLFGGVMLAVGHGLWLLFR